MQPPTLGRALGVGGGLLDLLDLPVDCALGPLAARLQRGTLLLADGCGRILKSVDSSSQIRLKLPITASCVRILSPDLSPPGKKRPHFGIGPIGVENYPRYANRGASRFSSPCHRWTN